MSLRQSRRPILPWKNTTYRETLWAIAGGAVDDDDLDGYKSVCASCIYFMLDPDSCQIKIGYTARRIEFRMAEHLVRRPNLELLGVIPGDMRLESLLHSRFSEHRVEGREWFSSEIIADIYELLHPFGAPSTKEKAA